MFPHHPETNTSSTLTSHHNHHHRHRNPSSTTTPSPPHHHPRMPNEEADSQSNSTPFAIKYPSTSVANDGATIEVVRRPRGRPPGSKNKPKPPVIITQDSEPSMSPYVLEVSDNTDIVDAVTRFCRKRNMGLCILNGNGVVTNVTLKQPSATPGAVVTFHGHFNILSISATVLPGNVPATNDGFKISLAGPQGHVVGGIVVGPLISAGTIYLISATFNSPSFQRLPLEDDHLNSGEEQQQSPPELSGSAGGGGGGETSRVPVYSYQPSDVIWTPAARQPPPPPPPGY